MPLIFKIHKHFIDEHSALLLYASFIMMLGVRNK